MAYAARTAFASYASADRQRVLDRVASVRTAVGLDLRRPRKETVDPDRQVVPPQHPPQTKAKLLACSIPFDVGIKPRGRACSAAAARPRQQASAIRRALDRVPPIPPRLGPAQHRFPQLLIAPSIVPVPARGLVEWGAKGRAATAWGAEAEAHSAAWVPRRQRAASRAAHGLQRARARPLRRCVVVSR